MKILTIAFTVWVAVILIILVAGLVVAQSH